MSKQRVVSNLLIMGLGQIATWGLSLVYLVLQSRYLRPDGLGELTVAFSIMSVFGIVVAFGMDTVVTRSVSRAPERTSALASAAMIVRGMLAIPVLLALFIYVHLAHLNADTRHATYIMALAMVIGSFTNVALATFQAREEMSFNAAWMIGDNALILALGVLVMALHGGVVNFATNTTLVALLLLVVNLRWLRRFARLTWRVSRQDLREVITGGTAFLVKDIFLTIYLYIDTIILAELAGDHAVGIYAPATRMFNVALFVPTIAGLVTLPLLSRLGVDAGSDFVRAGRKTLSLLIACGVPVAIGLATFAGPLILTVFGADYQPSVPVLVVLSLCLVPMFLNIQFYQTLTACDRQWRWTLAMAVSCVANPLINLVLIPLAQHAWHNGAVGAALSLLVTELLMNVYGLITLRSLLHDRALGRTVVGALAAGAVQGAVLWSLAAAWPPLVEALGVAAYGAIAVALGAVPRGDITLIYDTILGRARRLGRRGKRQAHAVEPAVPQVIEG